MGKRGTPKTSLLTTKELLLLLVENVKRKEKVINKVELLKILKTVTFQTLQRSVLQHAGKAEEARTYSQTEATSCSWYPSDVTSTWCGGLMVIFTRCKGAKEEFGEPGGQSGSNLATFAGLRMIIGPFRQVEEGANAALTWST